MNILVLNSGSSSVKYELYDMDTRRMLVGGSAERIGEQGSRLVHGRLLDSGQWSEQAVPCSLGDHAQALGQIAQCLDDSGAGAGVGPLGAIGHRVVHGGEDFVEPTRIDAQVVQTIGRLSQLAPLHNPANLLGIETALAWRPDVPQVAVFDTAFHHTMGAHAYRYAVPDSWYQEHGVRRYGFHGTSHAYVTKQVAALMDRPVAELNLITLHLGNGASVAAVQGGRSVDTSMGLTPLEGLVMGTRSGDVDAGALLHVARRAGLGVEELDQALNKHSGLRGLCGAGDVRDVLAREAGGDAQAGLALQVYVHRIRKYIGAYTAVLGRVDALVFTAGVGENSAPIRARVCAGLEGLGVAIDPDKNEAKARQARPIHAGGEAVGEAGAGVAVWVVPTNEELEIAEQTLACIGG